MSSAAASLPDDPIALKAIVAALQAQNIALSATVRVFEQHIASLQLRIAKLKRQAFGKASEKVEREIEQLELALEGLLIARAEADLAPASGEDDAPIRVLDRSLRTAGVAGQLGKGVRKGRIWAYVFDQRPWAGQAPPGVAYKFAPDWKAEHVLAHLRHARGILQADAYKGYAKLYEPGANGVAPFREAACWAHLRRDFHDLWTGAKSPIAREALDRIGAIYDIEAQIVGKSAEVRHAVRQAQTKPKVEAFHAWAQAQLTKLPAKGDLTNALRYALTRWPAFCLFLEDGRVAIDNNPAERALKPIAIARSFCPCR